MNDSQPQPITIEFFHDVMSCWCFHASERMRALVAEHPEIEVVHRSWPLATDPSLMTKIFPSADAAREEICGEHWKDSHDIENDPRINYQLMLTRSFDYPYSMPSQRGCKAAQRQGGHSAHWDFFDRAQRAHLTDCVNTADKQVLEMCAEQIGLDMNQFRSDWADPEIDKEIFADVAIATNYGILRAPTLVAEGKIQCHGETWSTFGHRITKERLDVFYGDIQLARKLEKI